VKKKKKKKKKKKRCPQQHNTILTTPGYKGMALRHALSPEHSAHLSMHNEATPAYVGGVYPP